MWSFQRHALLTLQRGEAVLLPMSKHIVDPSNWSINRQSEDPALFCAPAFLEGDPHLGQRVLVCSVSSRLDQPNIRNGVTVVILERIQNNINNNNNNDRPASELLVFDQLNQPQAIALYMTDAKHWKQRLTFALDLPYMHVTAACWVLDRFLLLGTSTGHLWIKPRHNMRSSYYVQRQSSPILQLTGLYNVLAMMVENTLCLYHVTTTSLDPFVQWDNQQDQLLFQDQLADARYTPLLYGPYVVYRRLDGDWVQVLYDGKPPHRSYTIRVPHRAGWPIVGIKSANWRSWTLTLRDPKTQQLHDYVLLAGGVTMHDNNTTSSTFQLQPFLLGAQCMVCDACATHKCARGCGAVYCQGCLPPNHHTCQQASGLLLKLIKTQLKGP